MSTKPKKIQLRWLDTHHDESGVAIIAPPFVMGRDLSADLPLHAPDVSHLHARIYEDEGRLMLEDLNAINGTYHNQHRCLSPPQLQIGDTISIGSFILRLEHPHERDTQITHRTQSAIETAQSNLANAPTEPRRTFGAKDEAEPKGGHRAIETDVE